MQLNFPPIEYFQKQMIQQEKKRKFQVSYYNVCLTFLVLTISGKLHPFMNNFCVKTLSHTSKS